MICIYNPNHFGYTNTIIQFCSCGHICKHLLDEKKLQNIDLIETLKIFRANVTDRFDSVNDKFDSVNDKFDSVYDILYETTTYPYLVNENMHTANNYYIQSSYSLTLIPQTYVVYAFPVDLTDVSSIKVTNIMSPVDKSEVFFTAADLQFSESTPYEEELLPMFKTMKGQTKIFFGESRVSYYTRTIDIDDFFKSSEIYPEMIKYIVVNGYSDVASTLVLYKKQKKLKKFDVSVPHKRLTVRNADKIVLIGDSYSDSSYVVKGKAYINKLSQFSLWNFTNHALSGDVYVGNMNRMLTDSPRFSGVPTTDYGIRYAMMNCFTNDIKYMNYENVIRSLESTVQCFQQLRIEPILCTEYHTGTEQYSGPYKSALFDIARRYNLKLWDISQIVEAIRGTNYVPFWGGSHPGTRANALEAVNYQKFLKGLERPMSALKIYRKRSFVNGSNLDNLRFYNIETMSEKFKEIVVGHQGLKDNSNVDTCTDGPNQAYDDEYGLLIKKSLVLFDKFCLIRATLPAFTKDISYVSLHIQKSDTNNMKVYCLNVKKEPIPVLSRLTRYDIPSYLGVQIKSGAVYKDSSDNKEHAFIEEVAGIADGSAQSSLFFGTLNSSDNDSGTLTKVSGTGPDTITYSYKAVGYLPEALNETNYGHWDEVEYVEESDSYLMTDSQIMNSTNIDTISFLCVGEGEMHIYDIYVEYDVYQSKYTQNSCIRSIRMNKFSLEEELIGSPYFNNSGTLDDYWNVTPTSNYEHTTIGNAVYYPSGATAMYKVTDIFMLNTPYIPINKVGWYQVDVLCRYFPPIYSDGSGEQITEDSYDYSVLQLKVTIENNAKYSTTQYDRVDMNWQQSVFYVFGSSVGRRYMLTLSAKTRSVEIAGVSMKFVSLEQPDNV